VTTEGPLVRTSRGWASLVPGAAPLVGESTTLQLRQLRPGATVRIGPESAVADERGGIDLRLPRSLLSGTTEALVPVEVDGQRCGELEIVADKMDRLAFQRLRADLEATWTGLAFDPEGYGSVRATGPRVGDLWRRIAASVEAIRQSPRTRLARAPTFGRIEQARSPGSLRPSLLRAAARGGIGVVDQIVAETDVPENRLVRETLERLARVARRQDDGGPIADVVARYLRMAPFDRLTRLRGPLRPTHGVLRDPRYRVVYEAALALEGTVSAVVEGPGELRLGIKSLPRLYEYWVFLQVLRAAHRRFGPPLPPGYATLAQRYGDRRARLDLPPGTTVEFPGGPKVAFEPEIRQVADRSWEGLVLVPHPDPDIAASLAKPDVVVLGGGPAPRALVIDAKYVARPFVELEAAWVHARYARMLLRGRPVVERVLVAHPHAGLSVEWAGYGHLPFVPGGEIAELPWPMER
jgi:hypothetical protein